MSAPIPPRETEPILVGPREVCKALAVSMSTLYELRKDPTFPRAVYVGDRPKWRVEEIKAWTDRLPTEAR